MATGVLPALVLGLAVMFAHGAPIAWPLTNLAAAVIGSGVVLLAGQRLAAFTGARPFGVASVVLGLELGTLVAPGIDGVHRWISLGGLRLHPAAIGDPVLLLAVIILWHRRRHWLATLLVAAGLALHVVQPDAGQATALAAGAIALALLDGSGRSARPILIVLASVAAVLAWLRPDPLAPVDLVENIVPLAFSRHPAIGVLAIATLAMLPLAPLWHLRAELAGPARRPALGVALAAYLLAGNVVVAFGEFPTPVLGFGASPIFGALLGLGLLAGVRLQLAADTR